MKYSSGEEVELGDIVSLGKDSIGMVVSDIDNNRYSRNNPKEKWSFLKTGVIIEFEQYGLIHYIEPEEDLSLVKRYSEDSS